MSKKVAIVFGTRPEIIKMAPVIKELEKGGIENILIHTGQHNLESLLKDLSIRIPNYILDMPPESAGRFRGGLLKGLFCATYWSLFVAKTIRNILRDEKPSILLYEGDTLAVASASIAGRSFFKRPILGHMEAGLRTGDILDPFPEELARLIADKVSDLLFAPTMRAVRNLERDSSIRGKIFMTGNTVVDAVLRYSKLINKKKFRLPKNYAVVFIHRQENVHFEKNLLNLSKLLSQVNEQIIFIEHPTTTEKLKDFGLIKQFKELENIKFKPLCEYLAFLNILNNAKYVITDSGGVQEEICSLRVPCLIWRKKTERPEAVRAGASILVGDDWRLALKYIEEVRQKKGFYKRVMASYNPFGDGTASKRIVDIIEEYI